MTDHPKPASTPEPTPEPEPHVDDVIAEEPISPEVDDDASPSVDAKPKPEITQSRRWLWVAGFGIGGYMVARGLWGLATGEGEEP